LEQGRGRKTVGKEKKGGGKGMERIQLRMSRGAPRERGVSANEKRGRKRVGEKERKEPMRTVHASEFYFCEIEVQEGERVLGLYWE